jgi:hypothetical protein
MTFLLAQSSPGTASYLDEAQPPTRPALRGGGGETWMWRFESGTMEIANSSERIQRTAPSPTECIPIFERAAEMVNVNQWVDADLLDFLLICAIFLLIL